ncbi:MarR family transcriptional regulator [Azospirillum sp.]|uniref:MarR family winged helix-turn-helix transcriptional regulator n=1 Tax=Azospirillum sp. TaxID=34012 RepID=UPI002D4F86A7|nr:MarR family transcriptional regulator [Azospirillum sp.]HYD63960.1 MarR family transcriptional regulator [Azospirillum sp.]
MDSAAMTDEDEGRPNGRGRGKRATLSYGLLPGLVGYTLRKAQAAVFEDFQKAVAPHDITPGQFGVLIRIRENAGLSQSALGTAIGIDRSTMVAVIDRLESRGLVVRAPAANDRRSYALKLSDAGLALLDELIPRIQEHERSLFGDFSDEERARFIDLLRRVGKKAA